MSSKKTKKDGVSKPGVKYVGPVFDASGYAEAARNSLLALHATGYPVTLSPTSFSEARPDLGDCGELLRSLVDRPIEYDKVILHSTPDAWRFLARDDEGKYLIGCTVWETSGLHPVWARACAQADEVWVPSEWNVEVFRAGLDGIPVVRVPYPIQIPDAKRESELTLPNVADGTWVFYSIFEWQERKNPADLVLTYLSTFSGVRDVALVLKASVRAEEEGSVAERVERLKRDICLNHYPRIHTISEDLSRNQIADLHRRGDCFVLVQRAEGWGLPHIEAAACGNPVITTAYGGPSDFLDDDTSYLVDYSLRPVSGMPWSAFYLGTEHWCSADLRHAGALMRHVYDHREEARATGARARAAIAERYSYAAVGRIIAGRLREIDRARR